MHYHFTSFLFFFSPYKNDPLQYIRPQPKVVTNTASVATPPKLESVKPSSPSKKTPAYRSVSPTRMASPRTEASTSVKPHPLQFVSPQKAKVAAATQGMCSFQAKTIFLSVMTQDSIAAQKKRLKFFLQHQGRRFRYASNRSRNSLSGCHFEVKSQVNSNSPRNSPVTCYYNMPKRSFLFLKRIWSF